MKAFNWAQLKSYSKKRMATTYMYSFFLSLLLYSMAISNANLWIPQSNTDPAIVVDNVCPEMLLVSIEASSENICAGERVELVARASGGQRPYSYEWYDNAELSGTPIGLDSALNVTPMDTTNYFVKVTTTCDGAIEEAIADIIINAEIEGARIKLSKLICDTTTLNAYLFAVRGVADRLEIIGAGKDRVIELDTTNILNFELGGIPSNQSVTIIASLTGSQCSVELTINKNCDCPPDFQNVLVSASNDTTVCGGQPVQLEAIASGGVGGYTYNWYNVSTSPRTLVGQGENVLVSPFNSTIYEIEVLSQCGSAKDSVSVETFEAPRIDSIAATCDFENGVYCLSFSSTTPDFTITPNSLSANEISAGVYEICGIPSGTAVTISAGDPTTGCTTSKTFSKACLCDTITSVTILGDEVVCEDDSTNLQAIVVGGSAPYDFLWSLSSDFSVDILSTDQSFNFSPAEDTTVYLRVVTNDQCDTANADIFIDLKSKPVIEKDSIACLVEDSLYQIFFASEGDVITTNAGILRRISPLNYLIDNVPIDQTVIITSRFQGNEECEVVLSCPPPSDPCFCKSSEVALAIETPDTTVCQGSSINLMASVAGTNPPFTVNWYDDSSLTNQVGNGTTFNYTPNSTGLVYAQAVDDCNQSSSVDSVFITVDLAPELILDSTACEDLEAGTYVIFFTSNTDELTNNLGDLNDLGDGQYSITNIPLNETIEVIATISSSVCPADTLTAILTEDDCDPCLNSDLTVQIEGQSSFCLTQPDTVIEVMLSAITSGGESIDSILWYDNSSFSGTPFETNADIIVMVTGDTTFYVRVVDALGCDATNSFSINFNQNPTITTVFECSDDKLSYNVTGVFSGTEITATLGDVTVNGENYSVSNIPTGNMVTITATDAQTGCQTSITVDPELECCFPEISCEDIIEPNRECILRGDTTQLFIVDSFICPDCTYEWSPAGSLNDPTARNPIAAPQSTTTYTVQIFDENGCFLCRDTVTIPVLECGPENVFFPDLFTPNGDNVNDILTIRVINVAEVKVLLVNRFGQVLKDETWFDLGEVSGRVDVEGNKGVELELWDGRLNGNDVPPDVYGYFLEVTCNFNNEKFTLQGNVTLLR